MMFVNSPGVLLFGVFAYYIKSFLKLIIANRVFEQISMKASLFFESEVIEHGPGHVSLSV